MLICNERSCQANCMGGCRSVSVAGSDRGRDFNVAAQVKIISELGAVVLDRLRVRLDIASPVDEDLRLASWAKACCAWWWCCSRLESRLRNSSIRLCHCRCAAAPRQLRPVGYCDPRSHLCGLCTLVPAGSCGRACGASEAEALVHTCGTVSFSQTGLAQAGPLFCLGTEASARGAFDDLDAVLQ
jgi:hypothetical protein